MGVVRAEERGHLVVHLEDAADQLVGVGPDDPTVLVPHLDPLEAAVAHPVGHHRVERGGRT